ncbi:MAG: phenylalanine--tRNA ligase subunit beta [Patescibacteria group bacterium]
MKISLDWLSDFVTFTECDPEKIAKAITAHTAEVDDVGEQGALLKHCVVGKVLSMSKHPNADRLSLCEVKTDKGTKKVVCGGSNLRVGMKVAFAHAGARVRWHGTEMVTLEKTKIRGEESEGMICTAEELDLTAEFPASRERVLIDLGDDDAEVGTPLRAFLGLTDTIFHIDNHAITHRADLFSHIGFARECVAINLAVWKKSKKKSAPKFPKDALPFHVHVENPRLMPRYCATLVQIEKLGKTPEWMKNRLIATGWRPVNLPVDITNYVLMEIGVPLHSFDADDIKGNVVMNAAKEGERITTLDKTELKLPAGALVLRDDLGVFDLLGIMGGLRSSTKQTTRSLYLHSASLDPVSIRRTVIATGHRTDAAMVYEKGVPPMITEQGFYRALELFLELIPGAKVISKLETYGKNGSPKPIELSHERLTRMLGADVPAKEVERIFKDLDFNIKAKSHPSTGSGQDKLKAKSYVITPPLTRLGDIKGEHDLIEEIGRMHGYDAIAPKLPEAGIAPPKHDPRLNQLRDQLQDEGAVEILPLSLLGSGLLSKAGMNPKEAVEIENPLGEELSLLQTSTFPGLLEHAGRNLIHTEHGLKTFTVAHVFAKGKPEITQCGILVAEKSERDLKHEPFLQVKEILKTVLGKIGYGFTVLKNADRLPFAHPARSAVISVAGKNVGTVFELHPSVQQAFDLPGRAAAVLLNWSALQVIPAAPNIAKAIPEFPGISYDVTIPMDQKKEAGTLIAKMQGASEFLENVEVVDLYSPNPRSAMYQLTLRFTYRAKDRTLTENEVQKIHEKILASTR